MTKILLGKLKADAGTSADGENVWLTKHEWSCNWYWSFGWVGNKNCHFHFDSLLCIKDGKGSVKYTASELFESTNISDKEWWVMRDLFVQSYALKKAAEVYRYGGHQSTVVGVTDLIRDDDMAKRLNADLEKTLNTLWDYTCKAIEKKEEVAA
jgi:hypothetical protein